MHGSQIRSDAAVAVLCKGSEDTDAKATLACILPWGHGFGWSTLPSGGNTYIWSGGKYFSFLFFFCNKISRQCESVFILFYEVLRR